MTRRQLEELLHHERFLQWLARRLLRDAAQAEDVVQDTWLAVLHSNKSPSEVHRGWLAAVVRNLALRKLREERRRTRREELVARPNATPAAPSPLAAQELRVQLAKLVLRLPEHYRDALLLRYYEGLEPVEIAARTGVSASTVRTRIQRALARIRHDLGSSTLSIAPLLHVIAAGAAPRRLRFVPLAAAGVVLVAVLSVLQGEAARYRASFTTSSPEPRVAIAGRKAPTPRSIESPPTDHEVVPTRPAPTLLGRVALPPGMETDIVRIAVTAPGNSTVLRATTSSMFLIDLSPLFERGRPANLRLVATHADCETVTRILPTDAREVTIALVRKPLFAPEQLVPALPEIPAAPDEATTTTPERTAVVRASAVNLDVTVYLPDDVAPEPIALAVCRVGRCLRFRVVPGRRARVDVRPLLDDGPTSLLVVRAASRHTETAQRNVPVWAGPRLEPLELRLKRGRLVRGQVTWEDGTAGAGVSVAVAARGGRRPRLVAATIADSAGRFEFALPEAEDDDLSILAVARGAMPASAPPSDEVRLILREGAAIVGRVGGVDKSPSTRVSMVARESGIDIVMLNGGLTWTARGPQWSALSTRTNDRGAFRFDGLAAGVYVVRFAGKERDVRAPGEIGFAARRVLLTVVTTDEGAPVSDAAVTIGDTIRRTDAKGRASFAVLLGTTLVVGAEARGYEPVKRETMARPRLLIDLTRTSRLGRLKLIVAARDAPLMASTRVILQPVDRADEPIVRKAAVRDGAIRIDALLPGTYKVAADLGGWHFPATTVATVVVGDVTLADLRPPVGGRVRASTADAFERPAPGELRLEPAPVFEAIAQRDQGGSRPPIVPRSALPYRSDALISPGRYRLWIVPSAADAKPRVIPIEVSAGLRTLVELSQR